MKATENRRADDAVTVRDPMLLYHLSDNSSVRNAGSEAAVRTPAVVQLDNATPTILSFEKSGTRGIRGSVVLSRCTKRSPKVAIRSVDAALRISAMTDRWKCRHGCLKPPPVITCV